MKKIGVHIGTFLSIIILVASLLPALHVFDHELTPGSDDTLSEKLTKSSVDCELCEFRFSGADVPTLYVYEIFTPQKESVYAISLAETVNLFPKPLFSLRAPPAVIG